jgi:hypothetical protein
MKVRDIRKRAKSKFVSINGFKFLRESQSKRCRTYVAGCATCDTWRFYDERGRFPSFPEVVDFMFVNEEAANEAQRNLMLEEMTRPPAVDKSSHMMSCPSYKSGDESACLCKPS